MSMDQYHKSPHEPLNKIKYGITTGTGAAAAAKAALLTIKGEEVPDITLKTPLGELQIEIKEAHKLTDTHGRASVIKKAYNDPDVTTNLEIVADIWIKEEKGITINGGKGVGRVTKPGLQVPVGQSAINPIPQKMIKENLEEILPDNRGAHVAITVPKGEELAWKTLNPKLGIKGGISILGTTGIARSMNMESYKKSFRCQLDVARAEGFNELIFVPGNIGENIARQLVKHISADQIIQMGNFPGFMLEEAAKMDIKRITLIGHAGKLIKLAAGIFNTEHRTADGRREVIVTHAALSGADINTLKTIFLANTTEEMMDILDKVGLLRETFNSIAQSVIERCHENFPNTLDVVIVKMDGTILNSNHQIEL